MPDFELRCLNGLDVVPRPSIRSDHSNILPCPPTTSPPPSTSNTYRQRTKALKLSPLTPFFLRRTSRFGPQSYGFPHTARQRRSQPPSAFSEAAILFSWPSLSPGTPERRRVVESRSFKWIRLNLPNLSSLPLKISQACHSRQEISKSALQLLAAKLRA